MSDALQSKKVPPETMALRGRPRPVKRLSRKAFMIGTSLVVLLIIGAGSIAIKPTQSVGAEGPTLYNVSNKPIADAVNDLPGTYDQIAPTVDNQETPIIGRSRDKPEKDDPSTLMEQQVTRPVSRVSPQSSLADPALSSGLFFNRASERRVISDAALVETFANETDGALFDMAQTGGGYRLAAGSVIPASLITGINSDLPGTVTAQVTQPVFDTTSGQHLLIPQGTRLIGRYDNQINQGQRRVFLTWSRMTLPNGQSFVLDDLAATDGAGYSGLTDKVDNHTGRLVRAGLLSTLLGVGAEFATDDTDDDVADAIREGLQGTANQAGQQIIQRELNIPPTLTIRPGWSFQIIVTGDLVLPAFTGRP